MAADMQRKRSSECPDGMLAPSDGQSVERAESPTPGLAQGMEPGMGRVHSPSHLKGRAASRAVRLPIHSCVPIYACMCSLTHWIFVMRQGFCRDPGSVCTLPFFPFDVVPLALCCLAASGVFLLYPGSADTSLTPSSSISSHKCHLLTSEACSDHGLYRTVVIV